MQKITIVEDDPAMREELVLLLENEGYQVQAVTEFTEVVAQVRAFGANLVLLDLGLPGRDGFSLCADLRKTCGVPIILVTSRNSTMDELRALSLGGMTISPSRTISPFCWPGSKRCCGVEVDRRNRMWWKPVACGCPSPEGRYPQMGGRQSLAAMS